MIKPETAFIQAVHRKLKQVENPPLIKKLADRFTNGLPDVLYISPSGINLWVEYKIHPNKPTAIQRHTLKTLMEFNQKIGIITKTPHGSKIYDGINDHDNNEPWFWILNQLEYNSSCHNLYAQDNTTLSLAVRNNLYEPRIFPGDWISLDTLNKVKPGKLVAAHDNSQLVIGYYNGHTLRHPISQEEQNIPDNTFLHNIQSIIPKENL